MTLSDSIKVSSTSPFDTHCSILVILMCLLIYTMFQAPFSFSVSLCLVISLSFDFHNTHVPPITTVVRATVTTKYNQSHFE